MTTALTISTLLAEAPFQIEMDITRIPNRTDSAISEWDRDASHWHVQIRRVGCGVKKLIVTQYSMGSALKGAPLLADVIYCLHRDSRMIEELTFESWADEYGYDSGSQRAESIYRKCVKLNREMRQMFSRAELDRFDEIFSEY